VQGGTGYNQNNYPNNRPDQNQQHIPGFNPNNYPNNNQGGSNVYIGNPNNNPNQFPFNQNSGGSNVYIGGFGNPCSSMNNPCLNGGVCSNLY
jgi:hypothetical protein